jgi:hypothetical protein
MLHVTSHLNKIVRNSVMVRFKQRFKSNAFINNTEYLGTCILNLNNTTCLVHFLDL